MDVLLRLSAAGDDGLSIGELAVHTATPAGIQRTAEHFRLHDGKITTIMLIFDAAPWQPMAAAIR
ncbi:hypothetical protein [Nonomuraea sp. NPDC049400]|uniref:hypothetical protein n=1 Tax=Nonomuraea sp. NPDC049400 TaxID=3364352 RepID=UPI0037B795E8